LFGESQRHKIRTP